MELTLPTMSYFYILLLLILTTALVGQELLLTLPSYNLSTPCRDGFRAELDNYSFTGTVGPNVNALYADVDNFGSSWGTIIKFLVYPAGSEIISRSCGVQMGQGEEICKYGSLPKKCYCKIDKMTSGLVHFVINFPAKVAHSNGTVLASWIQFVKPTYHKIYYNLPEIHDVNDAVLTLTVNGNPADTSPETCGRSFIPGQVNTVKLCCSKAAMPCYPRLDFNGKVVAVGSSPCVEYTFTPTSETVNVAKMYSVCSSTDYRPSGFCVINPKTPDQSNNLGLQLGLGLGIAAIIGIVLVICCWKKKLCCWKQKNPGRTSIDAGAIGHKGKQDTPL